MYPSHVNKVWTLVIIVSSSNIVQRLSGGHAGTQANFVLDAVLVCKASSTTGDYHKEVNDLNFTKWLTERNLTNLSRPSALVMDNVIYHLMQIDKSSIIQQEK